MDNQNAIDINNLSKSYDGFHLDNVTFSIPKGSIMGFVGQNGSGKSTTIKAILNIIKKDSGSIKIWGMDNIEHEKTIKNDIAVVFDEMPFSDVLNAKQINSVMSGLYSKWNTETYFQYLERFSLPIKKPISQFSKGMKMKLQIAVALSHEAKLLIMDEPTSGLDPVTRSEMLDVFWDYIQDENNTIFISSHITSDLERIADTITFIHNGKLLLTDNKDNILNSHGIIKCSKDDIDSIPTDNIVSIKTTEHTTSVMVKDRNNPIYSDFIMDNTTLDEILLFYVRGINQMRWSV